MSEPRPSSENLSGLARRPHVLWDMTFAVKSLTGTRVFAQNLFDALCAQSAYELRAINANEITRAEKTGNVLTGLRNWWWLQHELPHAVKAEHVALLHCAAYLGPRHAACPMVANILDTTYLAFPRDFDWKWRFYARTLIPPTVSNAAAILTLSEHARGEIARAFDAPRAKIKIVYPGVAAEFHAAADASTIAALRARYALPNSYVLFVGAQETRKNIPTLVHMLTRVRNEFAGLGLVLVGPRGSGSPEIQRVVNALGSRDAVREVGYVAQGEMPALYAGARAFVYASKLEGFGMPPLEAMACRIPVIAAPNPPLPEVLGDAAYFAPDDSPDALAQALARVLRDDALGDVLRARGLERAREFTWARAARTTIRIYDEILRGGRA
ncbi:MAG: glycosyltransferase family 4 protein [Chloroflexi bacterium]|nr:glycosyltransferase family 4 protein [Chloroflexota bacterium]